MVVYKLKCLTEGCDASYIGESKRICSVRMEDHESDPKSHVYEHHKLPGHEIDFANVEIFLNFIDVLFDFVHIDLHFILFISRR